MVMNKDYKYPDTKAYDYVVSELHRKGVSEKEMGKIAYDLQHQYYPDLDVDYFIGEVTEVLHKRETLNMAMTALALDEIATKHGLPEPLQSIVDNDVGVFSPDEVLALGIANMYGGIGTTTFGFVDKTKTGIIKQLDNSGDEVNTFIDDIVGGIVSAVSAKVAHRFA